MGGGKGRCPGSSLCGAAIAALGWEKEKDKAGANRHVSRDLWEAARHRRAGAVML